MNDALSEALRLQQIAALEGFDWTEPEALWSKLAEEIEELRSATTTADRAEELGDLLFMVVNLARHLAIEANAALAAANCKFARRYGYVMAESERLPPLGDPARVEQMELRWQEAKRRERQENRP